jgi:plastocyanin
MFPRYGFLFQAPFRDFGAAACLWTFLAMGADAATVDVRVENNVFTPARVNIQVGDTVRWTWVDGGHSVTSGSGCAFNGGFDSGVQNAGFAFSRTFNRSGQVPYFCIPHCSIGMTGVVNVAGGPSQAGNKPPRLKLVISSTLPKKQARTIDEGETVTIRAVATDRNRDVVSVDASGLPPGASWTPASGKRATGIFTWTPSPGTAATLPVVTVNFTATDQPSNGAPPLTTTQPVTLNVGQNTPPALDAIQPPPALVGKRLRLTVTATDADGDKLRFSTSGLPAGAKFKSKGLIRGKWTGVLIWKPTPGQAGQSFPVTFTVQDDFVQPFQDSEDVVFTVAPP